MESVEKKRKGRKRKGRKRRDKKLIVAPFVNSCWKKFPVVILIRIKHFLVEIGKLEKEWYRYYRPLELIFSNSSLSNIHTKSLHRKIDRVYAWMGIYDVPVKELTKSYRSCPRWLRKEITRSGNLCDLCNEFGCYCELGWVEKTTYKITFPRTPYFISMVLHRCPFPLDIRRMIIRMCLN